MLFSEVILPCGFLKLVLAESNGIEVSKQELGVARNSLIQIWTDLGDVIKKLREYKFTDQDYSQKALEYLSCMDRTRCQIRGTFGRHGPEKIIAQPIFIV